MSNKDEKDSGTARRPLAKTAASSTRSSTLARPTATSTPKASSLVSKPVTKRSVTTDNARKALSSSVSSRSATPVHRSQGSVVSAGSRGSEDEERKERIAERSKRMSMGLSATADRATVKPATTTTAVRRTSTATSISSRGGANSPSSARSSVLSPTSARPPLTASSRTSSTLGTKVQTTSSLRKATDVSGKRTIGTSSSSTKSAGQEMEPKETKQESPKSPLRIRPPLGARKSTRSILMQERIHELELVQQMLQSAVSPEDLEPEEREDLKSEAAETLDRLKASLAKIRDFEEQHGRPPSEEEIAAIESIEIDIDMNSPSEARHTKSEKRLLEEELSQSQAHARHLEARLEDLTDKLQQFSQDADEGEGDKSNIAAAEAARMELANKMRDMSSANQARLDHLRMIHREELSELRTQHDEELAEISRLREDDLAEKDTELNDLRAQIESLTDQVAVQDSLQTELEELQTSIDMLEKEKETTNAEIRELKENQADFETQKEVLQNRSTEVDMLRKQIAELSATQAQQVEEHHRGTSSNERQEETSGSTHQETLARLESLQDQLASKEEQIKLLHNTSDARFKSLEESNRQQIETLESELSARSVELTTATSSIANLETTVKSLRTEIDNKEQELSSLISHLQQELDERKVDLKSHTEKIQSLEETLASKDESHEQILEEINTVHTQRLKRLEDDGMASLASLEAIEAEHDTRIAKLQSDHNIEKEKITKDLQDVHSKEIQDTKNELQARENELETIQSNHLRELKDMRADHEQLQTLLREEHAQVVAQLQSRVTNHTELENSHAEQESRIRQLSSQAQSAQFQLSTMRNVMRSNEEESQSRIKELEVEVEKLEGQFNQAIMRVSQNSFQLSQKDASHAASLEQIRHDLAQEHEKEVRNLQEEHETVVKRMVGEYEAQGRELERLHLEHKEGSDALQEQLRLRGEQLERTNTEISLKLDSAKSAHESEVEVLKKHHANAIVELRSELENMNTTEKAKIAQHFEDQLNQKDNESSTKLADLERGHQKTVRELETELNAAQLKANDTTAVEKLTADLKSAQDALQTAQRDHSMDLEKMASEHSARTLDFEDQLRSLQAALEASKDNSEEVRLQNALTEAVKKSEELTQAHADNIDQIHQKHHQDLKTVEAELNDVKMNAQLTQHAQKAEFEHTLAKINDQNKTMLHQIDDLRRTIDQLNTEYATAVDEAETQRQRSERAEAEMQQLRQAAKLNVSATSSVPNSHDGAKSIKSSSKSGLKASKWAVAEDEVNESITNGSANVESDGATSPVRRSSVHGQLASINEDIRSLNDLSEQMLTQNRLMAKTLSRVDEHTGTVNGRN